MTDAEVTTTEFVIMLFFKGNFCLASRCFHECNYIQYRLRKIRFRLGETWKKLDEKTVYVIDSYPIAVCDNYLIKRSKPIMEKTSSRKVIEITCSLIERLLTKSIHAIPAKGFETKVALFVLSCTITFLW